MVNYQASDLDRILGAVDRVTAQGEAMEIGVGAGKTGMMGE
jgi:hypothetical protein